MEKPTITRRAVRQVLLDYWQQYKKHPWQTVFGLSLPAIGSIFIFFIPPLIIAGLINTFAAQGGISLQSAGGSIALLGASWLFGEGLWRLGIHIIIKLESRGISELGKEAFRRLSARDYDFYANNFVGSLTKQANAFSRGFEIFTDTLNFNIINNIFPTIFAVIILWHYSPAIPLVLLALMAIAFSIGIPIVRQRSKLVAKRHAAASRVSGRMSDAVTNILAVKSFAREEAEQKGFGRYVDDYTDAYKATFNYQNLRFDMAMSPLYVGTNVIGLITAIFFVHQLGLQAGVIVLVFTYFSSITRIFWEMNRIYRNIEAAVSEAAEFTQLMLDPPKVQDAVDARTLEIRESVIEFKGVSFAYGHGTEGEEMFLKDFDLKINGGQKIGLVGPSGSGKTTITKLLLRFIDLQSGSISIDGQDISKVTQTSLREAIAYVPQEPLLFHRSLLENIAYGNEGATEVDIRAAAKLARSDEFILELPHGYESLVGERGIKLSGGQRQRVAIARALLKRAPILVLDEATSSLDSESEKYIQEGLRELMKGRTALVIAHRLSTIKHLDRIIVLSEGRIVQDGTHDELIRQKGLYATLWSHQSGEFLEE